MKSVSIHRVRVTENELGKNLLQLLVLLFDHDLSCSSQQAMHHVCRLDLVSQGNQHVDEGIVQFFLLVEPRLAGDGAYQP